ncbi:MAG: hypothetical protein U1E65_05940 [Myxococcota bacterium]
MYCTECRGEFRPGITTCPVCAVPLVDALPEEAEAIREGEETRAVGSSGPNAETRIVDVEGEQVDLGRVYFFEAAVENSRALVDAGISTRIREVELPFPDKKQRYTVEVRPGDHAKAEALLYARWKALAESEVDTAVSAEQCPACGAAVPLDVEECPECGLFVGRGEEEEEEGEGEDAAP